ncbi:MAG TPA: YidC/Oxa1 family membrane protein insertase [Candidatus Saccharimonadales bacterium]
MFTTLIVQPIFNLLVLIYALLPGHNFGLAIILFTIVVRMLMWPLVKKQLHQVKKMRAIQPDIKRIKQETKGDKRREQMLTMELYRERGINPFGSIGVLLIQIPILLGLYAGLNKVIHDQHQILSFAYPALQHFSWMKHLAANIGQFDATLFHVVNLKQSAIGPSGVYWPAMIIVVGSAVVQFYQSKQLTPSGKDARSLRAILKDAGSGKQADQSEVNEAVGRSTRYLLPAMIFLFTVNIPSALALYWLTSGLVALVQQSIALKEDVAELDNGMASSAAQKEAAAIEGEVVESPKPKAKSAKKKSGAKAKRRKK